LIIASVHKFEKLINHILLFLLAIITLLATVHVIWVIGVAVISPPFFLLETHELMEILGMILLVMIGIELLHSVTTYITHRDFHLEIVISVAMIAITRKIITLDPKELSAGSLLGIAAMVFALAASYFLIRYSHRDKKNLEMNDTPSLEEQSHP
jgi:uncharacterized membrane protein (DUF373 family)